MKVSPLQHITNQRHDDPAASMALLAEVLNRPVDPGYRTAAQQRSEAGRPGSTGSRTPLLIVTMILLGFLLGTAAISLRTPDPQDAADRSELVNRIEAIEERGDASGARVEVLRRQVAQLQAASDGADSSQGRSQLAIAREQAGAEAVQGPGIMVTVDDPPRKDLRDAPEPGSAPDRVLAADVQVLVNGLWSVGAEAISINEQRLTSTSSIRFAGEAIIVDFRGITRPYEVRVIGDPDRLDAELDKGATGAYYEELSKKYKIVMNWERATSITAPAAERLTTRVATVKTEEGDP